MKIQNENSFLKALQTGVNIFAGSGFSVLAKDADDRTLPVGGELCEELRQRFNKSKNLDLSQISTILEKSQRDEFYKYLSDRFRVNYINPLYYSINNICLKNIYTTNIDNLIPQIFQKHPNKYLNDRSVNGPLPENDAVNYLPLHGYIDQTPQKLIFDIASIANIYNDAPRIWNLLSHELEIFPTIFLGYSFNDASVIQAITSKATFKNAQKDKWILLLEEDESVSEYFEALGFNTIYGNIEEFLRFIKSVNIYESDKLSQAETESIKELGTANKVPVSIFSLPFQRPIDDFFRGSPPTWSDILSNQLYKTHHIQDIIDSLNGKKNTIIIGSPVSGKTTALMQIASIVDNAGEKLIYDNITTSRAEYIAKLIGKNKATIFIDNLYDNVEALLTLCDIPNIKIIAAERTHNYSIISHLIDPAKYDVINITTLTDQDIQGVFDALPLSLRKSKLHRAGQKDNIKQDSLFEFVIRNITRQNIRDRYKTFMSELEQDDPQLLDFLVLCGFIHSCRIPLSFEMAYSYFDDLTSEAILEMKEDLSDLITDFTPTEIIYDPNIEYYTPRSLYLAETIRDLCPIKVLQRVLKRVVEKIPTVFICNYRTFRRYAFDRSIVERAFPSWKEGKEFYEQAFLYDHKNPYVLQQGALYLARKKQYADAFVWIDRALNMTDDRYFSIRNSHAIILFDANIDKNGSDVRQYLNQSMSILEKCMKDDARKRFHALRYGKQALQYYEKYNDDQSRIYVVKAKEWLDSQIKENAWDYEAKSVRDQLIEVSELFN
jgi:hypothetical protein